VEVRQARHLRLAAPDELTMLGLGQSLTGSLSDRPDQFGASSRRHLIDAGDKPLQQSLVAGL